MKRYCTEFCVKSLSYNCCYHCEGNKYCTEQCKEFENNIKYEDCKHRGEKK